jgi:hypothetical protein
MTNTTTPISPGYGMRKVKKLFLTGIFKGLTLESTAHQSLPVGHEFIDYSGNHIRIVEIMPE